MLRITSINASNNDRRLVLEGALTGAWVAELESVFRSSKPPHLVRLDLSHVHFVDAEGRMLLRRLLSEGAVVETASPFVQELLNLRTPC